MGPEVREFNLYGGSTPIRAPHTMRQNLEMRSYVMFVSKCLPISLAALCLSGAASVWAQQASSVAVEEQYRQGLYQRETGEPYSAIETLQSLLAAEPTLNRARLELAVSYYRTLNFTQARAEAQAVLADPTTPEAVRLSVMAFLKQLEVEEAAHFGKPHRFSPSFSLGALYDSNVNAGPDSALLSGGWVLNPSATSTSDWGYTAQAGLNHNWTSRQVVRMNQSPGRFGWNSYVGAYHKG